MSQFAEKAEKIEHDVSEAPSTILQVSVDLEPQPASPGSEDPLVWSSPEGLRKETPTAAMPRTQASPSRPQLNPSPSQVSEDGLDHNNTIYANLLYAIANFSEQMQAKCEGESRELHFSRYRNKKTRGRRWVLMPYTPFRSFWDITQAIVLCYVALLVPIRVGFEHPATGAWFYFDFCIDLYFFVDLVLNFLTAYVDPADDRMVITDHRMIAKNYLRSWFFVDFVATVPVDILLSWTAQQTDACFSGEGGCPNIEGGEANVLQMVKVLRMFRLAKLLRLTRLSRLLDRYSLQLIYFTSVINLAKFVATLFYAGHLFACLYGASYELQDFTDAGYANTYTRWLASFYWAVQTMTTVGYGDFPATNTLAQLVAILTMIFGGFMFSYLISNMSNLIAPDASARENEERMRLVLNYLKEQQLAPDLAAKVLAFFKKQALNTGGKAILDHLPYVLRSEVFDEMHASTVKNSAMFGRCSEQAVHDICMRLHPVNFPQGDYIYHKGEIADEMFFVEKGCVYIVENPDSAVSEAPQTPTRKDVKLVLETGNVFGEAALLGITQRIDHVFSPKCCQVLTLRREAWMSFLELHPSGAEELLLIFLHRLPKMCAPDIVAKALKVLDLECLHEKGVMTPDWMEVLKSRENVEKFLQHSPEDRQWRTAMAFAPTEDRKQAVYAASKGHELKALATGPSVAEGRLRSSIRPEAMPSGMMPGRRSLRASEPQSPYAGGVSEKAYSASAIWQIKMQMSNMRKEMHSVTSELKTDIRDLSAKIDILLRRDS
ncbi:hypothetical protein CYMTET_37516 [Cymbomonas tetramitiformis]|uniref:Cyclic nucleotide-binding domain-containing protein n=1 Tax=Cymbomonas tetramitiformis TaxID=36881 RepID=A0AAE0CFE7_9CHLO|nr:hypothetical protein CYMTET_37516 [Cymbomonas tetramitiformis]